MKDEIYKKFEILNDENDIIGSMNSCLENLKKIHKSHMENTFLSYGGDNSKYVIKKIPEDDPNSIIMNEANKGKKEPITDEKAIEMIQFRKLTLNTKNKENLKFLGINLNKYLTDDKYSELGIENLGEEDLKIIENQIDNNDISKNLNNLNDIYNDKEYKNSYEKIVKNSNFSIKDNMEKSKIFDKVERSILKNESELIMSMNKFEDIKKDPNNFIPIEDPLGINRGICNNCTFDCLGYFPYFTSFHNNNHVNPLSCINCGCGASNHSEITTEKKMLSSNLINVISSKITGDDIHFNGIVVIFTSINNNDTYNNILNMDIFRLLYEGGFDTVSSKRDFLDINFDSFKKNVKEFYFNNKNIFENFITNNNVSEEFTIRLDKKFTNTNLYHNANNFLNSGIFKNTSLKTLYNHDEFYENDEEILNNEENKDDIADINKNHSIKNENHLLNYYLKKEISNNSNLNIQDLGYDGFKKEVNPLSDKNNKIKFVNLMKSITIEENNSNLKKTNFFKNLLNKDSQIKFDEEADLYLSTHRFRKTNKSINLAPNNTLKSISKIFESPVFAILLHLKPIKGFATSDYFKDFYFKIKHLLPKGVDLVYFSEDKLKGLVDCQYIFPEIFISKQSITILKEKVDFDSLNMNKLTNLKDDFKISAINHSNNFFNKCSNNENNSIKLLSYNNYNKISEASKTLTGFKLEDTNNKLGNNEIFNKINVEERLKSPNKNLNKSDERENEIEKKNKFINDEYQKKLEKIKLKNKNVNEKLQDADKPKNSIVMENKDNIKSDYKDIGKFYISSDLKDNEVNKRENLLNFSLQSVNSIIIDDKNKNYMYDIKEYNKKQSIYKDLLCLNSIALIQNKSYDKIEDFLKQITQNSLFVDDSFLKNFMQNLMSSNNEYNIRIEINNIAKVGSTNFFPNDQILSEFFEITNITNQRYIEILNNVFFKEESGYNRFLIVLRPIIVKVGLSDTILNILKINNFVIIHQSLHYLTRKEAEFLFHFENLNEEFKENYISQMTESYSNLVVVSRMAGLKLIKILSDGFLDGNLDFTYSVLSLMEFNKNKISNFQTLTSNSTLKDSALIGGNLFNTILEIVELDNLFEKMNESNINQYNYNIINEKIFSNCKGKIENEKKSDKSIISNDINNANSIFTLNVKNNLQNSMKTNISINTDSKEKNTKIIYDRTTYESLINKKKDLIKFCRSFNICLYKPIKNENLDHQINFFFPKLSEIEEAIIFIKYDHKEISDYIKLTLESMQFEILNSIKLVLTEEDFDYFFERYFNLIEPFNFSSSKEKLIGKELELIRLVKPSGFKEIAAIIGEQNYSFIIDEKSQKEYLDHYYKHTCIAKSIEDYYLIFENKLLLLRSNCYLLSNSFDIEKVYYKLTKLDYVLGDNFKYNNEIKSIEIEDTLNNCIKNTICDILNCFINKENNLNNLNSYYKTFVKETASYIKDNNTENTLISNKFILNQESNFDNENSDFSSTNSNLLIRYLRFYHLDDFKKLNDGFLSSLSKYVINLINKIDSKTFSGKNFQILNFNYSKLIYDKNPIDIFENVFTFLIETSKLGFCEIKFPIIDNSNLMIKFSTDNTFKNPYNDMDFYLQMPNCLQNCDILIENTDFYIFFLQFKDISKELENLGKLNNIITIFEKFDLFKKLENVNPSTLDSIKLNYVFLLNKLMIISINTKGLVFKGLQSKIEKILNLKIPYTTFMDLVYELNTTFSKSNNLTINQVNENKHLDVFKYIVLPCLEMIHDSTKKRIELKTKFESNKVFYHTLLQNNCYFVPSLYNYRIKPDDITIEIKRCYEIEEFTGLPFLEIVIQDIIKYRPPELDFSQYSSKNQLSLPAFLWGKKLASIYLKTEKINFNFIKNSGPLIFSSKNSTVEGIIDSNLNIDYEKYLYTNILHDLQHAITNKKISEICSMDEINAFENTLFTILESDSFKDSRKKENLILCPVRIEESNLRIKKHKSNMSKKTIIKNSNTNLLECLDPFFEQNTNDYFKSNDNYGLKEMLHKAVFMTNMNIHKKSKFHLYASLLWQLNVNFKKLYRKSYLIESNETEYDNAIETMISGFNSVINLNSANDKNKFNKYKIEYFLYGLTEMKFNLNELEELKTIKEKIENKLDYLFSVNKDRNMQIQLDKSLVLVNKRIADININLE